jgi:hypothetical protein
VFGHPPKHGITPELQLIFRVQARSIAAPLARKTVSRFLSWARPRTRSGKNDLTPMLTPMHTQTAHITRAPHDPTLNILYCGSLYARGSLNPLGCYLR